MYIIEYNFETMRCKLMTLSEFNYVKRLRRSRKKYHSNCNRFTIKEYYIV